VTEDTPIGVFDSGVGGLTVVRSVSERLPREEIVYLGDTARVPYGSKSAETVARYSRMSARFLLDQGVKMLLVDNDDCYIHTLANYARQTGAAVVTYRAGFPLELIGKIQPDLILISPGPGRPSDFGVPDVVKHAARAGVPVFGVCLGLQGIVEAFGGELGVLDYPMHGKPSLVRHSGVGVFEGLPEEIKVGRYHSLYAIREKLPAALEITAESDDGVIMGVRHRELPIEAVQFHPESLLTLEGGAGLKLIENVVKQSKLVKAAN